MENNIIDVSINDEEQFKEITNRKTDILKKRTNQKPSRFCSSSETEEESQLKTIEKKNDLSIKKQKKNPINELVESSCMLY